MTARPEMLPVQAAFQRAIALHRGGRFDEAEGIYRRILAAEPRHFDALRLLGVVAGVSKDARPNDPPQLLFLTPPASR